MRESQPRPTKAGMGGGVMPIPALVARGRQHRPSSRVRLAFLEHHRAEVEAGVELRRHRGRLVPGDLDADGVLLAWLEPVDEDLAEVVAGSRPDALARQLHGHRSAFGALVGVAEHGRAGDERRGPAVEVPVIHSRLRAEAVAIALEPLGSHASVELGVLGEHQLDRVGRAHLRAARLGPAVVKEVDAAGALSYTHLTLPTIYSV